SRDIDAGGSAHAKPLLLNEIEDDRQRLLIRDLVGEIGRETVEIGGDTPLPYAFGDRSALGIELAGRIIAVKCGAQRIGQRDPDVTTVLAKTGGHTSQCAT